MYNRASGTDGGGSGTGTVHSSLYHPQQDWTQQNSDERQPQKYQEKQQWQLQQWQIGAGLLYDTPGSQVQNPSDPRRLQNEQHPGLMSRYHHGGPLQYTPVQGKEQHSEQPGRVPLNVDSQQSWSHLNHQAWGWKSSLGGRGIGQEVKHRDSPPLFVPRSDVATKPKTISSNILTSPPLTAGSNLQVGAAEFVPGRGCQISDNSCDDGNLRKDSSGVHGGGVVESMTSLSTEDHHLIQPQQPVEVQVGRITVDPAVMSEMYEAEYVDDGFDWSMGASSLAVLPHRKMNSTMLPQNLWAEFHRQVLQGLKQIPPNDSRLKELPPHFYAAFPLDDSSKPRGTAGAFGYPSSTYKVVSHVDGQLYALRRLDKVRTTAKIVNSVAETWISLPPHPCIVTIRGCFYHAGALFCINDYHPCAETLWERYIVPSTSGHQAPLLNEKTIWNFACQLLCGIRAVHAAGLACWGLDPRHILYCLGSRLKLAWLGVVDVVEYESSGRLSTAERQSQDMRDLGRVLLSIAFRMEIPDTAHGILDSLSFAASHFSPFMHHFLSFLMKSSSSGDVDQHGPPTAEEAIKLASSHVADCLDVAFSATDALQGHLAAEYDNGRLVRLLMKLGMLNERLEHGSSGAWSETGDRYILKLFRDYVFHQVDVDAQPVIDVGHIIHSLNKLDAGEEESIILTSRDQCNLLIVTFADVKRCLEESFSELVSADEGAAAMQHQQHIQSDGMFGGPVHHFPAMG